MGIANLTSRVASLCIGGSEFAQFLEQASLLLSSTDVFKPKTWRGRFLLRTPQGATPLDALDTNKSTILIPGTEVEVGLRNSDGGISILKRLKILNAQYDPVKRVTVIEAGDWLEIMANENNSKPFAGENSVTSRSQIILNRGRTELQNQFLADFEPFFYPRGFDLLVDENVADTPFAQEEPLINALQEVAAVGQCMFMTNKMNQIKLDRLWNDTPPQTRTAFALRLDDVADLTLASSQGNVPRSTTSRGTRNDTVADLAGLADGSQPYILNFNGTRSNVSTTLYTQFADLNATIPIQQFNGTRTASTPVAGQKLVVDDFDILVPRGSIFVDGGLYRPVGYDIGFNKGFGYLYDTSAPVLPFNDAQLDQLVVIAHVTLERLYDSVTFEKLRETRTETIARCLLQYHYEGTMPDLTEASQLTLVPGNSYEYTYLRPGGVFGGFATITGSQSDTGEGRLLLANGGHREVLPSDLPALLAGTASTIVVGGSAAPLEGSVATPTITRGLADRAEDGLEPTKCIRDAEGWTCLQNVNGVQTRNGPETIETDYAFTLDQHRRMACTAAAWNTWTGQRYDCQIEIDENHIRDPERYWWGGAVIDDRYYIIDAVEYELSPQEMSCKLVLIYAGQVSIEAPRAFEQSPVLPVPGDPVALVPDVEIDVLVNVPFHTHRLPVLNVDFEFSDPTSTSVCTITGAAGVYNGDDTLMYGAFRLQNVTFGIGVYVDTVFLGSVLYNSLPWSVDPVFVR